MGEYTCDYTYDDWAELLAGFFFDEAHDGEEILFAVDERSLAEASGLDETAAAESLAAAVRLVIGKSWNVRAVKRLVERWRRGGTDQAHPAIPFLSLTVLAASRMGSYEGFAPHKFYVPLRRALLPEDTEVDAPGTYLEYVRWLWDDLARWANVDRAGRFGRLTIRDPGPQYGRGLAMQHALVKSYDLRQLDLFFRRIGLQPGEDVSGAELRRALAVWTAGRSEPWAQRLHRVCAEEELREYAEALLGREARRWDGRPRDPRTGRPVGRLCFGFRSARHPQVAVYAQWDERLPEELELSLPSGEVIALVRRHGWFAPHPLDDVDAGNAMADGVELRGKHHRFDLRSADAYAFAYDDDLGCWVSVDRMSYGDRYNLIVRQEVASEVIHFVQAVSTTEAKIDEAASRLLPPGWRFISGVRIDARPTIALPACLAALIPAGSSPRLRLLGGLPLTAAHGVYLRGGEPAVALSALSDDDRISITRVSTGQVERFRAVSGATREVPLWKLRLEPDRYEIQHGESKVSLQIVDGIAEAAGPGAGTVRHCGRGQASVVGTVTSDVAIERIPLTVPAPAPGDSLILLGCRPGDHHVVELPSWLSSLVGFDLSWKKIDAWPEFEPVWLVMRGVSGRYEASLLRAAEPDVEGDARETQWARLIRLTRLCDWESEAAEELWGRYRACAGAES
jgi:hypothetical protein